MWTVTAGLTSPATCPAPCPTLPCLQVATTGVTVNAVCPGYVMTELIEKQLVNQAKTRGIPKASWQRACVPTWLQPQALLTCIRWRVDGWLMGGSAALLT